MEKRKDMYARILLEDCLQLSPGQPLLIKGERETYDFVRMLYKHALDLGVTDIYLDLYDEHIVKELYQRLSTDELKMHPYFNKGLFEEYAKKDAAFLMLSSENPGLMDDVDSEKIAEVRKHVSKNNKYFNERRDKNELAWCIASMPTLSWAEHVFKGAENSLDKLWDKIFHINYLYDENPIEKTKKNMKEKDKLCSALNNLNLKSLHFKNDIGTDVTMDLLDNGVWATGTTTLKNGKSVIVNYPSLEIFTSPNKYSVNGVIKSSMPLVVAGVVVEGIEITLENGKIIDVKSETNQSVIEKLINNEKGANYIGEIALVENDSPISNTNILYYTTLLDENASCHFAFGAGFTECLPGSDEMNDEEKEKCGLNVSNTHVDVMFGTKDLSVIGTTQAGEEVIIFDIGNFSRFIKSINE